MKDSSIVSLLRDLNLTEYEAKALTTLFKYSESDAPTISRNSQIPKTRIYDVLDKLKAKGLVLEVYKSPKTFKVINPNDIFKQLIDSKKEEFNSLSKKVDDVVKNKNWDIELSSSKEKILQVNNLNDYNKFLSQELQSAQKEVLGFTHLDERIDSLKSISQKTGLNVKLLTKPMSKVHNLPDHFNVQEANHSMDAFIVDGKKVIMALTDLSEAKKSYHLTVLENNPTLANALSTHFDGYWKK